MRLGRQSSEFAVTVTVCVCATIALLFNTIDADRWLNIIMFVASGYTLSRGIAKHGSDVRLHADDGVTGE